MCIPTLNVCVENHHPLKPLFNVLTKLGLGLGIRVTGLGSLGPEFEPRWLLN